MLFRFARILIFDYDERNDLIKPSLEKTGMYEKISDIGLDRPYSKKFFENGVELSGGEQQRLVISRAYCKNSKVLILTSRPPQSTRFRNADCLRISSAFSEKRQA